MNIQFTKMQGIGNDYIYINCIDEEYKKIYEIIPKMCDRHFGIGADGVILILNSDIADFKMRIFNADGSEAQMCGNGIRCMGKYLYDNKITNKSDILIETLGGIKKLKLENKNGIVNNVRVDMGEPIFNENKSLNINDKNIILNCVSMGNPHAITIVNDVMKTNINEYGPIIENDTNFPEKTNVEFVEILDRNNIRMRVWERGSKETLACGTGACASVASCCRQGLINRLINVYLLGGVLTVYWNENDNHIYMKGPAKTIFEGTFEI